jgi:hypothetical protein
VVPERRYLEAEAAVLIPFSVRSWKSQTLLQGPSDYRLIRSGNNQREVTAAKTAPTSWARTNPGASDGAMPAKLSLMLRATVIAGLAKLVEEVNQYAAVM